MSQNHYTVGFYHSYYGGYPIPDTIIPKHGVHNLMIDEHIKKTIEKEKDTFSIELVRIMTTHDKAFKKTMAETLETIKEVKETVGGLKKYIDELIKLNKLTQPDPIKKIKKKAQPTQEEDESDDGYL